MEMHQIRYFLAVCDTLNFTRAAEKCGVSQPSLTRAIQGLEDELGGLLFRRERNRTHLTDLGELMRPHLERMLHQTEAAKSTAQSLLEVEDAPFSLGVMCTIGPLRFVAFLARLREAHPTIRLSLIEDVPAKLCELLLAGKIEAAVMAQPDPFPATLTSEPLYDERFMIAFPPGHRFEAMEAVRVADLDGESYLSRLNCEYFDMLRDERIAQGVRFANAYRSEREDWIQTMVMAGMGICFIPEFSPVLPGLPLRPVIEPEIARRVSLVAASGRQLPGAVTGFMRAIKAYRWPTRRPAVAA